MAQGLLQKHSNLLFREKTAMQSRSMGENFSEAHELCTTGKDPISMMTLKQFLSV